MNVLSYKALTVRPDWMACYLAGIKTVECRTWQTDYRGDIILCSSAKRIRDTIPGHALMIARLDDIVPFAKKHLGPALLRPSDVPSHAYAWIFKDFRLIKPVPVKGHLGLWDLDIQPEIIPGTFQSLSDDDLDRIYGKLIA